MRTAIIVAAACIVALPGARATAADYAQEVSNDRPVVWLRFADATSADGATAKDETGAHPATYHGSVALEAGVAGTGAKAAVLDGTKSYVEIPNHKDFALNTISVECWFRSAQTWTEPNWPASATLVSKGTSGAASSDWVLLGGSASGRQGCVMARPGPKGSQDEVVASPGELNDDNWHHVVWTRSADGQNRLFVDGAQVAAVKDSGGSITNDRPLQIGGDPFLNGRYLEGALAEVAIYNTVLDESSVAAHFKAVALPPAKPRTIKKEAPSVSVTNQIESAGGWVKYEKSPVLGGQYGTCFDIAVLREGDAYRMWVSWRPKKSVALVESKDGLSWSAPEIVLPPAKTFWEEDINRPSVLKRDDGYHMWYTGQAKGRNSWIGYATSPDGKTWKRMSDKPVLSFDHPWEKVAVMCPHVLWDEQARLFRMWY
ncbi:MAG: LamG domain-containing protein, partial [Planctomycetota bacterium]|nr:LamG domain-containing protein [Planctomycetota bacterium]